MEEGDEAACMVDGLLEPNDGFFFSVARIGIWKVAVFCDAEGGPGWRNGDGAEEGVSWARDHGDDVLVREGVDVVEGEFGGEAEGVG